MGRQRKRNSPDLILTLDLGGSLTKGIYVDKSGEHRAMCMEPEAIEIPKSSIDNYERNKFGDANPSDAAWVGTGDTYYAVGYLAATQFNANAGLNQLKVERAVPKVLAAVWVAASEMELGCELTLALAVLLPPGEYESREALERELTESLADYETPAGRFHVTLTRYDCKPEGGGTYLIYKRLHEASLSQNTTAVVMVGYRNASVLNWKNLPHPNGKKTSLGGISLASIRSTLAC